MASIHKQAGRPFWFCAFTIGDSQRVFRSTRSREKKEALEICRTWEKAARLARGGKLTPDRAREVIAAGVADIFVASNREALPGATVRDWCDRWLTAKQIETEPSTHLRYTRVVERFLESLGKAGSKDIATIRTDDVARFRDREAKTQARNTANLGLKIMRVCFGEAVRQGLLTSNPASRVDVLKERGEAKRRAFTLPEIRRILDACDDNTEWRGMVLFGIYTGQRLGDLARLTWRAVNLETREIAFTAQKTGRRIVLPLAAPLVDYLESIPVGDEPNAPLFPLAASTTRTGTLSNRFREVLVSAGLAEPRTHAATGKTRNAARVTSEISFHSLRHSAVTLLKSAGVSNALAMEIVGHESAAVSRGYTHIATDDLRREIDKLPDVTKAAKHSARNPAQHREQ